MATESPINLVISTNSETPVISPLSSVNSSSVSPDSFSRSVSPGDSSNPSSLVNSPQSRSSSIGSRAGGHVNEETISSTHSSVNNSDDDNHNPENVVTRRMQGLTLNPKSEPSVRMKPITLVSSPGSGAHTRTSPLYTPGYYLVQKDGQVYNVEIPVDSTGSGQLSPGPYYPGTWSPSGLPHIQTFSPQPTPRGYESSAPVAGIYTEYQQTHTQHHQQTQTFLIHTSHLPQIHSRPESRTHSQTNSPSSQQPQHHIALVQPQPSTPSKIRSTNHSNRESPEKEIITTDGKEEDDVLSSLQSFNNNKKDKDKGHESENKIDNKHTKFQAAQEVHREMFYSADAPRTVLTTATPVGVLLPTGEVQVSSLVAPVPSPPQQKVERATFQFPYLSGPSLNKQEVSTPAYPLPVVNSVSYPYSVYWDPTTQQVTYGIQSSPRYGTPSPTSSGQPSPQGPVAIYSPTGEMTGPNSASSRAVYQFPITGEWGASPQSYYAPPQKSRGKGARQGPCLFVFHIPPSVTDDELHALFSTCGRVTSAKVMRNPHTNESKGFGFVNMANQREVEQAISTLHGYYWKNKYLKVSHKKKRFHSRN